ncbi:MAG: YibE/F family protein [Coprobacillaceae bacterium]
MKRIKTYQIILAVFFIVFGGFLYWLNVHHLEGYQPLNSSGVAYEKAEVLEITDSYLEEDENTSSGYRGEQKLKLEIRSGTYKGEIVEATNTLTKSHNILAKEGSELIICIDENNVGYHVSVFNYYKSNTIYFMFLFFALLIVIDGGLKVVKTLICLVFSFSCIIFFTLPLIFNGYSPILIAIITAILIALVSLILLEGLTKKVLIALGGTAAGFIGAGLVFKFFSYLLSVSGYNLDEVETMFIIQNNTGLQIGDVLFAGVLIAAVGAVVDVAMSIASSLHELKEHNNALTTGQLFKSGMNIGQDLIGTMADTLILAYAGGSFSTMILYMAYSVNYNQLINMDTLVLEIAKAL